MEWVINSTKNNKSCALCPRHCTVDRGIGSGFCGVPALPHIARIGLHMWEEPPVSGETGSGTIFFTGCNLRCVYCQNHDISTQGHVGKQLDTDAFIRAAYDLKAQGAVNLNLVTPTPQLYALVPMLHALKNSGFDLPIVYNTNSYITPTALNMLDGVVDVYLADLKYISEPLCMRLSGAADYGNTAINAITAMFKQCGHESIFSEGLIMRGVIIRHLVLPGNLDETRRVLDCIAERFGITTQISLMGQYFPAHRACEHPDIARPLLKREYRRALDYAIALGFENIWAQQLSSATADYVPEWTEI